MKKYKTNLIVLIVVLVLLACAVLSINKDSDLTKGKTYQPSDYVLELPYEKDFRVLQLGDIHLGTKDDMEKHLDFLKLTIKDSKANLIVLSGDIFTYADKRVVKRLFAFIDGFGIPWTMTFGNHDEQCMFSIDWLSSYLSNYGSHCVFVDHQDDNVFGNANFVINLMKGDEVFHQIFLLDSNRYNFGEYKGYDYIKQSQIDWYEKMVNYTTSLNGSTVNSIAFFHIPVPEFKDAFEAAGGENASMAVMDNGGLRDDNSATGVEIETDYTKYTKGFGNGDAVYEYGYNEEGFSAPEYNSGLFDKMLELGSTKAIMCSHDHINNSRVLYKGVYFCYGVNSTNRIYRDENMMGGHVIVIHDDHTLSFEHIYHTYEELDNE